MRSSVFRTASLSAVMLALAHCAPTAHLALEQKPPEAASSQLHTGSIDEEPGSSSDVSEAIAKQADAIYHAPEDLVLGNPAGNVTLVAFFDYNCGYCQRSIPELHKLMAADKNVRIVIKEFPILGQESTFAAKAALAAAKQGRYAEFHRALTSNRGTRNKAKVLAAAERIGLDVARLEVDMADPSIADVIARNHALAKSLSIEGTPTFVLERPSRTVSCPTSCWRSTWHTFVRTAVAGCAEA